MKKLSTLAPLALSLVALLSACGTNTPANNEGTQPVATTETVELSTELDTTAIEESTISNIEQTTAELGEDKEITISEITGTVNDGTTMNVLLLDAEDGNSYIFIKDDNTKVDAEGLLVGNKVKVIYTGDLLNTPTATTIENIK